MVGATDLKPLDYLALTLLDEPLPPLPERTGKDERACIYLAPEGCRWPARWRPLKCALFYCLGSGAVAVDASDARYEEIRAALEAALTPHLTRLLPEAGDTLLPLLPDPVAFADALALALEERLLASRSETNRDVQPDTAVGQDAEADRFSSILAFIAGAAEQLWSNPPPPPPGPAGAPGRRGPCRRAT